MCAGGSRDSLNIEWSREWVFAVNGITGTCDLEREGQDCKRKRSHRTGDGAAGTGPRCPAPAVSTQVVEHDPGGENEAESRANRFATVNCPCSSRRRRVREEHLWINSRNQAAKPNESCRRWPGFRLGRLIPRINPKVLFAHS